ncbi:MAG: hypothetical protein Q4B99_01050 [Clostridia bacterium]|nr:hypothetical protein [Clostridia bacterium]
MLCRNCGKQNEDYLEYCKYCGEELTAEDAAAGGERPADGAASDATWGFARSPKWRRPEFRADSVEVEDDADEGDVTPYTPARRFSRTGAVGGEAPDAAQTDAPAEDESPVVPVYGSRRKSATPAEHEIVPVDEDDIVKPEKIRFAEPLEEDYYYEGVEPDEYDDYRDTNRRGGKKWIVLASVAAAVVVLVAVCWIIIGTTYGNLSNCIDHLFNGNPLLQPVMIEKSTDADGESIVVFTVRAPKGTTIRFNINGQTQEKTIESGNSFAGFLKEANFIPTEAVDSDSPYVIVVPDITVISPDGVETKITSFVTTDETIIDIVDPDATAAQRRQGIPIDGFPVRVPELTLTITSPESGAEITTRIVMVTGTVSSNTATVLVEGQEVTVDETGAFTAAVELSAQGESTITVEASKGGYRTARQTINVIYNVTEIDIAFDDEVQFRTRTNTLTLSGTLEPGAVVSMSCEAEGISFSEPVTVGTDGRFAITATIAEVGYYDVTITVVNGASTSTSTVHLERAPENHNDYYGSAFAIDYTRLVSEPYHNSHYAIMGRVVEIIQESPYVIAKLRTTDGQEIYFQYHNSYSGAAEIVVSDTQMYNIACFPNGLYEGTQIPYVYVWFVLKPSA